jgi:hypothetical protein
MVATVLAEAGLAGSVLVICGCRHTEAISAQLTRLGHDVEIIELQTDSWYIEDWFGHMLKL